MTLFEHAPVYERAPGSQPLFEAFPKYSSTKEMAYEGFGFLPASCLSESIV